MMLPTMGRRYQIDYMSGLRYVFSPAYRAKIHNCCRRSTCLKLLYMLGGLTAVVISALLFLMLAIQGLLH